MTAATTVDVSQVGIVTVDETQPGALVSQSGITSVLGTSPELRVSQVEVIVVYSVKPGDPTIRAWTYTLDGHDFYVVRLGNDSTLVYDMYSEQWSVYGTGSSDLWDAIAGQNWLGAGTLPETYGSNVIAGDANLGTLFVLNPELTNDDAANHAAPSNTFQRVAYGQTPIRSRDAVPCFGVALYGSQGEFSPASYNVTLSTSDDSGHTFVDQGTISVLTTSYNQRVEWRSLGSMFTPGRLFRIDDDGAFVRIDGMELLEDGQ